jgi:hypothetical protein
VREEITISGPLARAATAPGEVRLSLQGLGVDGDRGEPAVAGVDLQVRAGEIVGETVAEGSLVLAVVRFEHATVASTAAPIQAVEVSRSTGGKIARALAPHAPKLVLVVSDGLHVNGTDLVRGLAEGLHRRGDGRLHIRQIRGNGRGDG